MKFAALENYLKTSVPPRNSSYEALQKFLLYASYVQDPLNVFRYMEETNICTCIPLYWYAKSEYLAEIGDYRNAFACLKKTEDMKEISNTDERAKFLNTQRKTKIYREQISREMMLFPLNKRRTVSNFMIMANRFDDLPGSEEQKNFQIVQLLEKQFPKLKISKEKTFKSRNEKKEKSWLYQKYEKEEMEIITESIIQSKRKNKESQSNMRFDKTIDSVKIIKKRQTFEDVLQTGRVQENANQYDRDGKEQSQCSYHSLPVGRSMEQRKKHVSFDVEKPKILGIKFGRSDKRRDKVQDLIEKKRGKTMPKKGILKNKSTESKVIKKSQLTLATGLQTNKRKKI